MATAASHIIGKFETGRLLCVTLVPSVSAADDGSWIDVAEFGDGALEVTIATTATVQIRGSSAATRPLDTAHGQQIGSDITASGSYDLVRSHRWLKARVSAWTAGAVLVDATLRPPGGK